MEVLSHSCQSGSPSSDLIPNFLRSPQNLLNTKYGKYLLTTIPPDAEIVAATDRYKRNKVRGPLFNLKFDHSSITHLIFNSPFEFKAATSTFLSFSSLPPLVNCTYVEENQ